MTAKKQPAAAGRPGPVATVPREILHRLLLHRGEGVARADFLDQFQGAPESWIKQNGALARPGFIVTERRKNAIHLRLGPGLGYVLSFGVGGERLIGALVGADGRAVCVQIEDPTVRQLEASPFTLMSRIRELGIRVLEEALRPGSPHLVTASDGEQSLKIIGATAAWPTPLDREGYPHGSTLKADGWADHSLRDHLASALGLDRKRTHCVNDADGAALCMSFEADESLSPGSIVCVHLSAGVGGGVVHQALPKPGRLPFIDSHLVGGKRGMAGEIGHCPCDSAVIKDLTRPVHHLKPLSLDRPCSCTDDEQAGAGHIESVIGARATLERLGMLDGPHASLAEGLRQLHEIRRPTSAHQAALEDVGAILAWALKGTCAYLDPALLMLTGPLACETIRKKLENSGLSRSIVDDELEIKCSDPKKDESLLIPLRGAALAVLRAGLYRGFFDHLQSETASSTNAEDWDAWDGWVGALPGSQTRDWTYKPKDGQQILDDMRGTQYSLSATATEPKFKRKSSQKSARRTAPKG